MKRPALPAILLATLAGVAFGDDTVWLSRGAETGQGLVMQLDGRCLVLTAAHVAGTGDAAVRVVDAARRSAVARLLQADTALDMALLEVPDPRGAGRDLCQRKSQRVVVAQRDDALQAAGAASPVWLDKVASASGELSRHPLRLLPGAPPDHLHLVPAGAGDQAFEPGPGHSGSPVWMGRARTAAWQADGTPRPVAPGARSLLGLYVGRSRNRSVVVAGDRVRDFVLQALEPLPPTLDVRPATVRLTGLHRGEVDRRSAGPGALEIDRTALRTVALELDLGRRETSLQSVTVHLAGHAGAGGRSHLRVLTSAYARPKPRPDRGRRSVACPPGPAPPRRRRCAVSCPAGAWRAGCGWCSRASPRSCAASRWRWRRRPERERTWSCRTSPASSSCGWPVPGCATSRRTTAPTSS